ncbi:MAG: hypothetical protein ACE5K7_02100, partial [Phycisphaerae bacterium]
MSSRKPTVGVGRGAVLGLVAMLGGLAGCEATSGIFRPQPPVGQPVPTQFGAPTVTVVSPATSLSLFEGDPVLISWVDNDPDDDATIVVFYDLDGLADSRDEVILTVTTEDPDGVSGDQFVWDTTGIPAGTYFVGVTISDGVNPASTVYALGLVSLTAPGAGPTLQVLAPQIDTYVPQGQPVDIRWIDD